MNPLTQSTADDVLAETAQPVDALDALLRQIVGGYFVLTDGQGSVSKWSEPAELLFARPSEEILGQGFFETLIGGQLSPGAQRVARVPRPRRAAARAGHGHAVGPPLGGRGVPARGRVRPGQARRGLRLLALPRGPVLRAADEPDAAAHAPAAPGRRARAARPRSSPTAQPWEGWRTAGTLVVFRPLSATPWIEEELARREAERELADAAAEERLTNPDPGVQGSFADLDDAAAVVARLLSAMERIDELERVAGGLPAQLEEARREAERRTADAARDAEALRAELQRALPACRPSSTGRAARPPGAARARPAGRRGAEAERRARWPPPRPPRRGCRPARPARARPLERRRRRRRLAEAVGAAEARALEAIADAGRRFDAARAGLEARLTDAAGSPDVAAQLERVRAEHEEATQAVRHELAATVERLERDREREREAARAELAAALERVEHVQRGADALREQVAAARRRGAGRIAAASTSSRARPPALARRARGDGRRRRAPRVRRRRDRRAPRGDVGGARRPARGRRRRHEAAAAELEGLRAAAAEVAALCATRSRATRPPAESRAARGRRAPDARSPTPPRVTSHGGELAALREAAARHDARPPGCARLTLARTPRPPRLPRCARPSRAATPPAPTSRRCARPSRAHEAAAAEIAALREAPRATDAAAARREAAARHEAATAELAALREAAARA